MDTRKRTHDGLTVCPECGKAYWPDLGDRDPAACIQDQFPKATQEQREQLVSGLCSTVCFGSYLGFGADTGKGPPMIAANGRAWYYLNGWGAWFAVDKGEPNPRERNIDAAGNSLFQVPANRDNSFDSDPDSIGWVSAPESQEFLDAINAQFSTSFQYDRFDGR
jgi:hypothetical protein